MARSQTESANTSSSRASLLLYLRKNSMLTACFSGSGGPELVQQLKQDARLTANKSASEGLNDMELLYTYLDIFGVSSRVCSAISRDEPDSG